MSTTTTRLALYKTASDGSENVNVVTDLLNNWDAIDLNMNFRPCTSSTRPSTPYSGQSIRETDTGRTLFWNGSSWIEIPNAGAATSTLTVTTTGATALAATTTATGTSSTAALTMTTNATAKRALDFRVTGDTVSRIRFDCSATGSPGTITLGDGTTADVNLYRGGTNQLKTDDDLVVGGALTVAGVGQMLTAYKTADQPVSNTTITDDTHLTFSVAANATYIVDGLILYGADPAADMKLGFTGPASATFDWSLMGQDGTQTGTSSPIITDGQSIGTSAFVLGGVTNNAKKMTAQLRGLLVTSGTAGTFKYVFAQQSSSANNTIMYKNSYMRLHRIA